MPSVYAAKVDAPGPAGTLTACADALRSQLAPAHKCALRDMARSADTQARPGLESEAARGISLGMGGDIGLVNGLADSSPVQGLSPLLAAPSRILRASSRLIGTAAPDRLAEGPRRRRPSAM